VYGYLGSGVAVVAIDGGTGTQDRPSGIL